MNEVTILVPLHCTSDAHQAVLLWFGGVGQEDKRVNLQDCVCFNMITHLHACVSRGKWSVWDIRMQQVALQSVALEYKYGLISASELYKLLVAVCMYV